MSSVPTGQIMAEHPYYENHRWKFLGTFRGEYDLWLRLEESLPDKAIITIRWRAGSQRQMAQYRVDAGPPPTVDECIRAVYEVGLGRAQIYIYGDPSVSPGCRR